MIGGEGHYQVQTWWTGRKRRASKTGRHGVATKFQCPPSDILSSSNAPSISTAPPSGPHAVRLFLPLEHPLTAQRHRYTRPTHTDRDTPLVSRRNRTQQAPLRHREPTHLPPVHVSCSPGRNREPSQHCQPRNSPALSRNQTLMART